MSKSKTDKNQEQQGSVSYPTTLTASTREDLFAQVKELKASAKDAALSAGAVARTEDGLYIIQIDILKE